MKQKMIIIGNVGKDPEMRFTAGGDAVTSFSVATNKKYTDKNGQKVEETTWFRVAAWGKQAELANQYLKQGSVVYIEGELVSDRETGGPKIFTRKDGTPGAAFEIKMKEMTFLPSGNKKANQDTAVEDMEL
jgi:single-strand DNA-binding protein